LLIPRKYTLFPQVTHKKTVNSEGTSAPARQSKFCKSRFNPALHIHLRITLLFCAITFFAEKNCHMSDLTKPINIRFAVIVAIGILLPLRFSMAAIPDMIGDKEVPSLAPLVREASPAVVNIATKGTVSAMRNPFAEEFQRFFGTPPQQQQGRREVRSAGSGVIVDAKQGYILTNHHVVENADEIEILLADNSILKAKIVGSDSGTDIAVVQVEDTAKLEQMPLGNSDLIEVGDFVVAIGNPFGLSHTVTSGIVSALGRTGLSRDGYEDFIQTDASINPGNSGGALINLKGELIGINSAIFSGSGGNIGIGFAIPVNIAKSIMAQLIEFGEVHRGLLGVSISDFNVDTAEAFGIEDVEGALVQEVVSGSAAEEAGIKVGDVIVAVDKKPISSASDLRTTIGLRRTGETVRIEVIREGKSRTLNATLTELTSSQQMAAADVHPNLDGAELGDYDGTGQEFADQGVLVTSVEPGSPAFLRGLRANDIIITVNRTRVRTLDDLGEAAEGQSLLVLGLRRGPRDLLLQIR
jgi:serine protease DegQ